MDDSSKMNKDTKELDLSNQYLTEIPVNFKNVYPKLEKLDLSNNQISEIPEDVFPDTLVEINLDDNKISQIHGKLPVGIKKVSAKNNNLDTESFTSDFVNHHPEIHTLDISGNYNITSLPYNLKSIENLTSDYSVPFIKKDVQAEQKLCPLMYDVKPYVKVSQGIVDRCKDEISYYDEDDDSQQVLIFIPDREESFCVTREEIFALHNLKNEESGEHTNRIGRKVFKLTLGDNIYIDVSNMMVALNDFETSVYVLVKISPPKMTRVLGESYPVYKFVKAEVDF